MHGNVETWRGGPLRTALVGTERSYMHNSRLFALVGVGIGVMGLFLKGLTTAGEGLLPTLSQAGAGFPDGIPTIWGGLATWAQVMLVVFIVAVVVITLRPSHFEALDRTSAGIVAVIGLAMLAYVLTEWVDAVDKAEALQDGFTQAAQASIISNSYAVTTSTGFVIVLVGTVLVLFGGILGFRGEQKSFF